MPKTTAERLKEIMKQEGLKQVDILQKAKPFCDRYNVTLGKSDLSQFVNGKVTPGQQKLTILGLALNVSEAWLMGLDVPKQRGLTICPVCGLSYAADFEPDTIDHDRHHEKFVAARNHFGICHSPSEFERIKREACQIVNACAFGVTTSYTLEKKIDATIKLMETYFSRSVWSNDYNLMHPTFDEYVAMLLNQKQWENSVDKEIYNALVYRYGKKSGLQEGKTICQLNPQNLEFNGSAFTQDEQTLICDYRELSEQGQEYIRQTMYMAKQTYKKMPSASNMEKTG